METVEMLSKAEQSKFSRMRSKLQLKGRPDAGDETGVLHEKVGMQEKPIASDLPIALEDAAADVDEDIPLDIDQAGKKKKNQSIHFNRSSPMKLVRVCKAMTPEQLDLISTSFSGGIARLKCSKLIPELCVFLMSCFDPNKCVLDFGERGAIPITAESVVRVLDVPMGSSDVPYYQNSDATAKVLNMFGISNSIHPNVATVEKELGPTFPADEAYLSKFVIFSISSVFAPTTAVKVSPKCYPSVLNPKSIGSLNWAKFIVDILCQTANAKDRKNWFKACMPYLMILYVDSLETDAVHVPPDGTRCTVWTNKLISTVAGLDTRSDGSFGALPLKSCFRLKMSLFISEPSKVEMFIKHHLSGNYTKEEMSTYRDGVINMYSEFKKSLASFIISMANKTNLGTKPKHVQPEPHVMNRTKRRRIHSDRTDAVLGSKHQVEQHEENAHMMDVDSVAEKHADKVAEVENVAEVEIAMEVAVEENQSETNKEAGSPKDQKEFTEPTDSSVLVATPNALNQLQKLYCFDSPESEVIVYRPPCLHIPQPDVQGSDGNCSFPDKKGTMIAKKKSVSFVVHGENVCEDVTISDDAAAATEPVRCSPTSRRPVTRSMSPMKTTAISEASPHRSILYVASASKNSHSPRRQTRLATSEATAASSKSGLSISTPNLNMQKDGFSEPVSNSMSRKLVDEFGNSPPIVETEAQKRCRELMEDCPTFDLLSQGIQHTSNVMDRKQEEVLIISSNESGDSLDKIYGTIDIPVRTLVSEKKVIVEDSLATSVGPSSFTPVPEAHKKRIVKPSINQKSLFVGNDKKQIASKWASEVYSKVCSYGGKTEDELNKEKIIDFESFYIYLWDLADSVRPGEWLSNSTCQVALHILSIEMAQQKKHVMPIRLADKLRNPNCIHDRFVKKHFKINPECRLDHKEQICFPVLQDLTPDIEKFTGHYYLIVLNLKAERFEVMDSLRTKGNSGMLRDVRNIVGSIKGLWSENYSESTINIQKWQTEYIETPKQKTTYDCGYFMLKFIELWNGRKFLSAINPEDMPTIRKQLLLKWLDWGENKISWQELLF